MENKKCNIKAFWFDLGNVIIPFDNSIAANQIKKYTKRSVQEIYDIIFDSPIVKDFSEGKINSKNFFSEVKKFFDLDKNITYQKFKDIWNNIFLEEDKNVCNLIQELMLNYKVIIVSNINKIHYEYIKKRYDIVSKVNGVILSYIIGAEKPDIKIYKKAIDKTGTKPQDVIYIDDREDLIKAAKSLGFNCIHYKGYKDLIKQLKGFGIDNYL